MTIIKNNIMYSREQQEILDLIFHIYKIYDVKIYFLVLMSIKNYCRSLDDLVSIISDYPSLDNHMEVRECILQCIEDGLIKLKTENDVTICYQDAESLAIFLEQVDSRIADKIKHCRHSIYESNSTTIYGSLAGGTSDGAVYITFLERLKNAQKEIWMPMLNTDTHSKTIEVLKERAKCGVHIKILMADYESVTSKIRPSRINNVIKWIECFKEEKNVEIRIYKKIEHSLLSSSVIIDGSILRLPIYDSEKEKSSDSTLIEFYRSGFNLNIITIVIAEIERIWNVSKPVPSTKWIEFLNLLRNVYALALIFLVLLVLIFYVLQNNLLASQIIINLIVADIVFVITNAFPIIKDKINRVIKKLQN